MGHVRALLLSALLTMPAAAMASERPIDLPQRDQTTARAGALIYASGWAVVAGASVASWVSNSRRRGEPLGGLGNTADYPAAIPARVVAGALITGGAVTMHVAIWRTFSRAPSSARRPERGLALLLLPLQIGAGLATGGVTLLDGSAPISFLLAAPIALHGASWALARRVEGKATRLASTDHGVVVAPGPTGVTVRW